MGQQIKILNQTGLQATSGFEMRFAIGSQHLGSGSQRSQPKHASNPDSVLKTFHILLIMPFLFSGGKPISVLHGFHHLGALPLACPWLPCPWLPCPPGRPASSCTPASRHTLYIKMACQQHLDSRCVLLSDPGAFGAGGPSQTLISNPDSVTRTCKRHVMY